MIFIKDRQNRFYTVNRTFLELTGYTREAIEGTSAADMTMDKDVAEAYWKDDLEVIDSGEAKRNIVEPLMTDTDRWFRTDKIPWYGEDGSLDGILGFAVEVTEQKAAQEALQKARDELELRVDERTRQLQDLNSLLLQESDQRMRAQQSAEGRQPGQEPVPGQHHPRDPHAHERHPGHGAAPVGQRAARGTARPCPGHERLGAGPARTAQQPHRAVAHRGGPRGAQEGALRRGSRWSSPCSLRSPRRPRPRDSRSPSTWPPTCPRVLLGDGQCVRRLLGHLADNAVKFTLKGKVEISVACTEACSLPETDTPEVYDQDLVFTVRDTGIGIPPEKMESIFAPLHPGRRGAGQAVQRQRPGPGPGEAAGGADGRTHLHTKRARQGERVRGAAEIPRAHGTGLRQALMEQDPPLAPHRNSICAGYSPITRRHFHSLLFARIHAWS